MYILAAPELIFINEQKILRKTKYRKSNVYILICSFESDGDKENNNLKLPDFCVDFFHLTLLQFFLFTLCKTSYFLFLNPPPFPPPPKFEKQGF